MSKFDELLEELTDAGVNEEYIDRLRAATEGSPLRKERDAAVAEATELRDRLAVRERADTFRDLGIDLNERQRKAIEASHEGDWTTEAVKQTAIELGWASPDDEGDDDLDVHRQMAAARAGGEAPGSQRITPETYSTWPMEKRRSFQSQHPEHTEALKRGQEVVGVSF